MRNRLKGLIVFIFTFILVTVEAISPTDISNDYNYVGYSFPLAICPDPPVISSIDVNNTTCGTVTGAITLNMAGNTANYAYNWSPNLSTTNTMSNLVAGTYRVTITDTSVDDCSIDTLIIVQNTDGPTAFIQSTAPTTCESSNGQATLGPANLSFQWDDQVTSETRINLTHRTYSVTATDPATSCYSILNVTIDEDNPLSSTSSIVESATCTQSNGTANITVNGGSGEYSYSWGTSSENTTLPPGDYWVHITDNNNGCLDSVFVSMPNAMSVGSIDLASITPAACNGGSNGEAVFNIQEGFPFGEASSVVIKDPAGLVVTNSFLSAGTYTAYLLDLGLCIVDSTTVQMTENSSLQVVPNVIAQTCTVGGIITLDVTGGVPPYKYNWEDIPGEDNEKNRTGLEAGNYAVTISDNLNCQYIIGAVNVGNECGSGACTNPVIITDVVINQSVCGNFNGSAKILINGDANDYNWSWSPESGVLIAPGNERQSLGLGTYTVTVTDKLNNACFTSKSFAVTNGNGPIANVVSTTNISCNGTNGEAVLAPANLSYTWSDGSNLNERTDLSGGYHFVTVSDGSCENIVTVFIDESKTLDATATINNSPTCGMNDGSVTITVANGSGSYTYDWGAGATHTGLSAGNYDVLVTDLQSGCDTTLSFILNNSVGQAEVVINGDVFTSCAGTHDGTVDFNINYTAGFVEPATIEILNHADSVITNGELFVGPHCIVVKDANGCIAGQGCFFVNSPLAINVFTAITPVDCNGPGAVNLTVNGGEGGYTYDWADLAGNDDIEDRTGLLAGVYSVTITDGHGCEASQDVINVPDICGCDVFAGTITTDSTNICDQKPNMIISATPDGNAIEPAGYVTKYLLSKASNSIVKLMSDTPSFVLAGSGEFVIHTFIYDPATYDVSTIDFGETSIFDINLQLINGGGLICASLDVVGTTVLVNKCTTCNLPEPVITTVDAHCGVSDGAIELVFSQDTTGFTYEWSPDIGNLAKANNLEAGAYYVTVSEYGDEACSVSKTVVVTNADGPVVTIDSIAPTICTAVNGFLELSPTNLDYLWENGAESYVRSSLTDTVYAIRITDPATGCFSMLAVEILQEDPMDATVEILRQPVCGQPNGHAQVVVTGGSGDYTFTWGNFEEKENLLPGEYTLVVVDKEFGCNDVISFDLVNNPKQLVGADSMFLQSGNCDAPFPICFDLPASNAFGYVFTDNGMTYGGNIIACGTDTLSYYNATLFLSGAYTVSGSFGGMNQSVAIVESQEAFLDSLKSWDPLGAWELSNNRFVSNQPQEVYGDLLIINANTGVTSFLPFINETKEQGIQLTFDSGEHIIYVSENATGCVDTLYTLIECITCAPVYVGPDTIFGGICDQDTGFLCLDIPLGDIADYTIRDNWTPYEGAISECNDGNMQLALTQGGHTIIITNNKNQCTDTLQLFVFCVPPPDFILDTVLYEKDHVEICLDNSLLDGTPIFVQELCQFGGPPLVDFQIDYSTFCLDVGGLSLGLDTLCVQVCDDQGECTMTYIYVDVLPRVDTVDAFVTWTSMNTFCIDTSLFIHDIVLVENLCPNSSGLEVAVDILGNTGCLEFTGLNIGIDTVCLAVCDAYDNCDTTIIFVESNVPKPDTVVVEMVIGTDSIYCVDVTSLPGALISFDQICTEVVSVGADFGPIGTSSHCLEIYGSDYGLDTVCYAFCDDQFCDTLVLVVNVIQDTTQAPVAIDDQENVRLNFWINFFPLENDLTNGTIDSVRIELKPQLGSVTVNDDFSFTYTPDKNMCMKQDSFTYRIFNKNGTDFATIYIDILCDEVTPFSALSPNGDGTNDFWYIQDIERYPENEVFVYNRWGNEIFYRKEYTNDEPWDGLWKDTHLPAGVYYYVIKLGSPSIKTYSGYIQISR